MHRQGLKTALSVRCGTNNEIVYLESGQYPLEVNITKKQMKFWSSIMKIMENNPDHYIAKLIKLGENTAYIKHYRNLVLKYNDPINCAKTLETKFRNDFIARILEAEVRDQNSKLGTYILVNPSLAKPLYDKIIECERVMITRYRTGSHNLRIERDRFLPNSKREDRICLCGRSVQTIKHVILDCDLLNDLREKYEIEDLQNGIMNSNFLIEMEMILDIKK